MPVTIVFQTQYEICAFVFLLAVTAKFFCARRFPDRLNDLFGLLLVCALADLALDITGSYTIMGADAMPEHINYVINTLFYALQISLSALMMTYVIYAAGMDYRHHPGLRWLLLPVGLFILFLLLNPFTKHIFFLQEYQGKLTYCRGPLFPFLYADTALYVCFTAWLLVKYRAKLDARQYASMFAVLVILILAMVIQYFFPNILLTGVAMALAMLVMFFTLQNPDDMLDHISGAFNYNAMVLYLDAAVLKNDPLHVIVVDVGGIRRINSAFGLVIGNKIFSLVGAYFNALLEHRWAFRMVGTRFLLAVPDGDAFESTVERLNKRFEQNWVVDGNEIHLVATIRYFKAQGVFSSAEEIIALIDETYSGISSGNWGQCRPIDARELELSHRKSLIESELRGALQSGEGLSLHYQPIYCVKSQRFNSAEALLRFECQALGKVSPKEFIPICEKCGLIFQIDDYVVATACDFLKTHHEFDYLELNLSSAEFFCNPMARIHAIVERKGIDPARICFEVTETAADAYPAMLSQFMQGMIGYGYRFALDDFGTGYSNIAKVASLPFYIAKIDKVLLSDDPKIKTLFASLAAMFSSIGVLTVVEGVEVAQQAAFVAQRVDYVQGYYYARPMPEENLPGFLSGAAAE